MPFQNNTRTMCFWLHCVQLSQAKCRVTQSKTSRVVMPGTPRWCARASRKRNTEIHVVLLACSRGRRAVARVERSGIRESVSQRVSEHKMFRLGRPTDAAGQRGRTHASDAAVVRDEVTWCRGDGLLDRRFAVGPCQRLLPAATLPSRVLAYRRQAAGTPVVRGACRGAQRCAAPCCV